MNEADIPAVPVENIREKVAIMEAEMLHMPQVVMTPVHHFAEGLYARELLIPAGTVIVGKVHLAEHLNFLMKGDITVWTDDGMKRLQAPCILKSRPGVKRVGLTHEDTIWVTVHATDEIEGCDVVALENKLTVPTMADYDMLVAEQVKGLLEGGQQ